MATAPFSSCQLLPSRPSDQRLSFLDQRRQPSDIHRHHPESRRHHRHRLYRHGPLHEHRQHCQVPANYTFTHRTRSHMPFTGLALRRQGKQSIRATDTRNSSITGFLSVDVS